MSQREKSFTVNDRRHFTPEGRAREEAETAAPGAVGSDAAASAMPAGPSPAPGPAQPVDFSQFLLSLGAQASLLLAAEPGSEGESLEGARQIISILEMLLDKTEGRRTDDETRVLEGLLFQLRLAYVERAKRT
jgi:hypothetical protein